MKAAILFVVRFRAWELCEWQDCLSDESDLLEECRVAAFAVL